MNELGARHFDRYVDADGADLRGDEIGTWDEVTAARASFVSTRAPGGVLARAGRRARGCSRGRELIGSRLAWSGFGYSLPPTLRAVRATTCAIERIAVTSVLLIYPFFRPRARPLALPLPAARRRPTSPPPARGGARRCGCSTAPSCAATRPLAQALAARRRGRRHLLHGDDGGRLPVVRASACAAAAACWSPAARCRPASPSAFLEHFDVVVRGEGEQTMRELARRLRGRRRPGARRRASSCRRAARARRRAAQRPPRPFARDLDAHPLPRARAAPQRALHRASAGSSYGFAITTVMSTRGCPFACEFCSNVVFGELLPRALAAATSSTRSRRPSRWATTASRSPTTCSP